MRRCLSFSPGGSRQWSFTSALDAAADAAHACRPQQRRAACSSSSHFPSPPRFCVGPALFRNDRPPLLLPSRQSPAAVPRGGPPQQPPPQQQFLQQRRTMAGHNKWSKIKRKKGAKDVARSAAHGRAARAIQAASRRCGGDMSDLSLQSAIAAARAVQLPRDRIDGAVERGANPAGSASDKELIDIRYDAAMPTADGKVSVIVTALTDNRNRTAANVRAALTKVGGEMLGTGANGWLFEHVGVAIVPRADVDSSIAEPQTGGEGALSEEEEERLLDRALEGGATDVDFVPGSADEDANADDDEEGGSVGPHALIRCSPSDLHGLVRALQEGGYDPSEFHTQWTVRDEESGSVRLSGGSAEKLGRLLDRLDEDDDVTNVYHNATLAGDDENEMPA